MRLSTASIVLAFSFLLIRPAVSASLNYCDAGQPLDAATQDRMIRVAAIVKRELEASGQPAALVSRSGLSLGWIGQRYSHAGVSSRDSANTPWSVRQLYYACDEKAPRIFDQGMSGFVVGAGDIDRGYVSIVTLPPEAARRLDETARNNATALALLGPTYSADAYPFSTQYQNCNQWLAELLAAAWSEPPAPTDRTQAQAWLQAEGYQPTELHFWYPLLAVARMFSMLNFDDHPDALLSDGTLEFSMPPAVEHFARKLWPEAQRIELCYNTHQVLIHRGWDSISDDCAAHEGDQIIALDDAPAPAPVLTPAPASTPAISSW